MECTEATGAKSYNAATISDYVGINVRSVRRLITQMSISISDTQNISGNETAFYHFDSLPVKWQKKITAAETATRKAAESAKKEAEKAARRAAKVAYWKEAMSGPDPFQPVDDTARKIAEIKFISAMKNNDAATVAEQSQIIEAQAAAYSQSKGYNRLKFDKFTEILEACSDLGGEELKTWVCAWNEQHQDNKQMQTSVKTIYRQRTIVKKNGKVALIGKQGAKAGKTKIPPEVWEHFCKLYLKQGGPSAASCYLQTLGRFCKDGDITDFASERLFTGRINKQFSPGTLCYHRKGFNAWNRKYAQYVKRDLTLINAGQIWVSRFTVGTFLSMEATDLLIVQTDTLRGANRTNRECSDS